MLLVGLTASACSGSGSEDAAPPAGTDEAADPTAAADPDTAAVVAELEALRASGEIDEIVVMRPGVGGKPPDAPFVGPDTVVLGARHILRAPGPDGLTDLWVLRVRSPELGGGVNECRVTVTANGSGAGCSPIGPGAVVGARPALVSGATGDGFTSTLQLVGPAGTTHLIVDTDGRRLGVVTIEGQALVTLDGCPDNVVIEAWQGDTMLVEEPAGGQFC